MKLITRTCGGCGEPFEQQTRAAPPFRYCDTCRPRVVPKATKPPAPAKPAAPNLRTARAPWIAEAPGRCASCSKPYRRGTPVRVGRGGTVHESCVPSVKRDPDAETFTLADLEAARGYDRTTRRYA